MNTLSDLYQFRTIIAGEAKTHENRYRATKWAMSQVRQGADANTIQFETKVEGTWTADTQAVDLFAKKVEAYKAEPPTEKKAAAPKQATVQTALRQLSKAAQLLAARETLTEDEWSTLVQAVEDVMTFRPSPAKSKK